MPTSTRRRALPAPKKPAASAKKSTSGKKAPQESSAEDSAFDEDASSSSSSSPPPDDGLSPTRDTSSAALRTPLGVILATDIPGVYRNRAGVSVDRKGRPLTFKALRQQDDGRFADVLGVPARSPAAVLKAAALDPRLPLAVRLKSAREAAPYFDKRQPLQVNSTVEQKAFAFDPDKLAALTVTEKRSLLELLKRLGVEL